MFRYPLSPPIGDIAADLRVLQPGHLGKFPGRRGLEPGHLGKCLGRRRQKPGHLGKLLERRGPRLSSTTPPSAHDSRAAMTSFR